LWLHRKVCFSEKLSAARNARSSNELPFVAAVSGTGFAFVTGWRLEAALI
jgi:hypothetical protein